MALIGNQSVLNKSHALFTNGTSTAGAYAGKTKSNSFNPSYFSQRRFSISPKTSFTEGHNLSDAYLGPWKSGGVASRVIEGSGSVSASGLSVKTASITINGTSSIAGSLGSIVQGSSSIAGTGSISTATVQAVSNFSATISGTGSIPTASLGAFIPIEATISGTGSISTATISGYGAMTASIDVAAAADLTASDIWNYDISSISTTGTAGKKLNDASSAGNPWEAELASNNTDGTFGEHVQKLLTTSKFIGLK